MKEATGEVSMTVITIVLVALVLALGCWLFAGANSIGRMWINDMFNRQINSTENVTGSGQNANSGAIDG